MNYLYQDETYKIRGCIMNVSYELGSGFLEKVYQEALEHEFILAGIPYKRQTHLEIEYRGKKLKSEYIADFICYDKIIIEIKAVKELNDVHFAQVLNYLKATNFDLGLLVNFGGYKLEIERVFNLFKNRSKS